MLKRVDLRSERVVEALRPFLFEKTEQFIHEMISFVRSPYEISTYDRRVQYDWPPEAQRVLKIRVQVNIFLGFRKATQRP